MANEVLLENLRDSAHAVNSIGVAGTETVYRDRSNQSATVRVTDASGDSPETPVFYVSRRLYEPWIRSGSQHSAEHGHADPDYIVPEPILTAA